MMPPAHHSATHFRDLIVHTAAKALEQPLRALVNRKAPLARQGEQLGHLDVLLRVSLHGKGAGSGVMVFEWPSAAAEHSVIRILERWSASCGETGKSERGALELERRHEADLVHLKVKFPVRDIPDELLELFELAARLRLADALRTVIERDLKPVENAEEAPAPKPPAPKLAPRALEPEPRPKPALSAAEQSKVDAIVHNGPFDPALHPHLNPNQEVTSTSGETYRLIIRRKNGKPMRLWIRVPKAMARLA